MSNTEKGSVKLPAIRFNQDGVTLYLAAPDSRTIHEIGVVDTWKPFLEDEDPDQGYQREIVVTHAKRIARFLLEGVDEGIVLMPTASVLNARRALRFEPVRLDGEELPFGFLYINEKLYIVDGQHRDAGFGLAIPERPELGKFQRPVVILEDVEKIEEIRQFHTINATAKRVRTDLADRLLRVLGKFEEPLEEWKAKALDIVDELNKTVGGPWEGRIKLPNAISGIASQRSMTESLKPVLSGVLRTQDADTVSKALNNLWEALRRLMADAFDEPKDYVLQKSVGVFAWHEAAVEVFLRCYQSGNDFSVDMMVKILSEIGDFVDATFWLSGKHGGAAAGYGGRGGFGRLAAEIVSALPEPEVVINV